MICLTFHPSSIFVLDYCNRPNYWSYFLEFFIFFCHRHFFSWVHCYWPYNSFVYVDLIRILFFSNFFFAFSVFTKSKCINNPNSFRYFLPRNNYDYNPNIPTENCYYYYFHIKFKNNDRSQSHKLRYACYALTLHSYTVLGDA